MTYPAPKLRPFTLALALAALSAACVDQHPLTSDTLCPCAPGWTCDTTENACRPDRGAAGTAGAAGTSVDAGAGADGQADASVDAGAADAPGFVVPPNFDPTTDPNCAVSPASYQDYTTLAELDALLVRRWRRCIAPQIPGEDVGVEFTADGHYYPLTRAADGHVVRRTGVDYEGTWQFYQVGDDVPAFGKATFPEIVLGGVLTNAPKFTNDPRQLRILFSPVPGKYLPLDP